MGFLAPLYALAALAIAGPIIFHLIQRQPRGQRVFSSLMFLSPSPPTLTRRSRLDHLLLLLMRALAIGLIAFAFARPYWRTSSMLNSNLQGRRIAVVLDTSASMSRPDVWQKAKDAVQRLLGELSPGDRVALYTLDSRLSGVVPIEEEPTRPAKETVQAVEQAMKSVEPGWMASELASGLKELADQMTSAMIAGDEQDPIDNQIVLISDLHEESGLGSLQGYPWPSNVRLDVRQIQPEIAGNATLSLVQSEDAVESSASGTVKVRVENNSNSTAQAFDLHWQNDRGEIIGEPVQIQVTAGQSRVIPVGSQPAGANQITLYGDAWDADNQLLLVAPEQTKGTIAFVGPEFAEKEQRLDYFLEQAPLGTPYRARSVQRLRPDQFSSQLPDIDAVIYQPVGDMESMADQLTSYVQAGGIAVVVLAHSFEDDQSAANPLATEGFLRDLTSNPDLRLSEAPERDFALMGAIDYTHPIFIPFADPRFNDFSKLRFWNHRRLEGLKEAVPEQVATPEVTIDVANKSNSTSKIVASFDDGTPFLIEQSLGTGQLWIMTAGWQPTSSTFALSSKFVPIMLQMLDPKFATRQNEIAFEAGESIDVRQLLGTAEITLEDRQEQAVSPDVSQVQGERLTILQPGLFFAKTSDGRKWPMVVRLPARESRLNPLDISVFEQYGVQLGRVSSDVERQETERQRSATELENQQRIWQWLLLAGLVILALETLTAGLFAKPAAAA